MDEVFRGVEYKRVATYFGVSKDVVSKIMRGVTYSDVTGIGETTRTRRGGCCTDSDCQKCRLNRAGEANVAGARAAMADVRCVACCSVICKPIGTVLAARGLLRCKKCPVIKRVGAPNSATPCTADAPCGKCRVSEVGERNIATAHATAVDVDCVACGFAISRAAKTVLGVHGFVRCKQCIEGQQ
ncbi:hypothetical protein ACIP5Y_21265 [Nocardia sp. NPDC088792]|uniref:hypothetical protein n=1 Tax=Nocardia sp. NPDC088792 TaxID=3364332 RepID=UPI0037F37868